MCLMCEINGQLHDSELKIEKQLLSVDELIDISVIHIYTYISISNITGDQIYSLERKLGHINVYGRHIDIYYTCNIHCI